MGWPEIELQGFNRRIALDTAAQAPSCVSAKEKQIYCMCVCGGGGEKSLLCCCGSGEGSGAEDAIRFDDGQIPRGAEPPLRIDRV